MRSLRELAAQAGADDGRWALPIGFRIRPVRAAAKTVRACSYSSHQHLDRSNPLISKLDTINEWIAFEAAVLSLETKAIQRSCEAICGATPMRRLCAVGSRPLAVLRELERFRAFCRHR